ncbi:trehalase isoform X1 [Polistes fuscatus]|uniref:trehalase isoform X1 n=2 Tax=Polistes fuscatus TaxID=30207 RepID=UPI001CAA0D2F|nr:trehalase isoform X1 [Polistes fuscatus]XP_043505118.1 trehalase isoform X1 [Polistes fuscatus]XP_043505119.1 trehalase isoform X1 [Polistes fuscatus]XP_043505120.1 trehalase isoform X1 [Polistes fuscatus]XP_043505121.1 trehalase isoform X1 [Polistes fuscatus]XP_043505122.1 trehalase isoform X1 [Polistes fuscatus]XP_043505123.1 trehalase isoform X1 [Polistes fuscatus]XP_043505124.1 trehalase isoform X1 [Polistes fuscatus]XP_043505125.1 trehalase isoform X1 [Polistes fuscatus]XP_04350512
MALMVSWSISMNRLINAAITFLVVLRYCAIAADDASVSKPPPCSSNIYCHGELLHKIQMASIYPDSKTFVDMKMKNSPEKTLALFREFMNRTDEMPTKSEIEQFVNDTFDPPASEFEEWNPTDWKPNPKFLQKINDPEYRKFGSDLNDIWKMLGRKMKDDVKLNEEQYSIIYVPNPVIVPGGRFREFYYWDSYWIIKGLLLSEMYQTARGMLSNFATIVDKIGFIPNGGRVYYKMRSHPPLLIPMVEEYLQVTNDYRWLKENFWLLEKEFHFWLTNRTVEVEKDGIKYTLARYHEESSGPRPESYREDVQTSQSFRTAEEKDNYYAELKTAAESGWDFSSRWFILDGTNKGNLTNLKTRYIIPVDLNAILYRNAVLLSKYSRRIGNATKEAYYSTIADEWKKAVTAVLWHDEVGAWLDYDIMNEIKRDYFYPTNILPLWTYCYDFTKREEYVSKVLKYLEKNQIMLNQGGIPTTLEHSGEQWDYPNAWPPLQYFIIMSLNNTQDPWAQRLAYEISERWVRSNYKAFNATTHMFEKYDATVSGGYGGGGEYEVQLGFGWSNGLAMILLDKYGQTLVAEDKFTPDNVVYNAAQQQVVVSTAGQVMTGILALIISLAAGFIGMVMYKRRQYTVPGPSTMGARRKYGPTESNVYRKRIAYTELKDMNND